MDFLKTLHNWCERRLELRWMKTFGGNQRCTWCRETANQNDNWGFEEWDQDPFLDVLTCGVCGGTSLWRFGMIMHFVGPLAPPKPERDGVNYYNIGAAKLVDEIDTEATP